MIISHKTLKTAAVATTAEDRRYANGLSHVQVGTDGACVATDGAVLLRARDRQTTPDSDFPHAGTPEFHGNATTPVLVPAEIIATVGKVIPKRSAIPVLQSVQIGTNGDGGLFIAATDLQTPISAKLPTGADAPTFPAWERVLIPEDRPVHVVSLGVAALTMLLKAAKEAGAKAITFEIPSEASFYQRKGRTPDAPPEPCDLRDAMAVKFSGDDVSVDGVVMPYTINR